MTGKRFIIHRDVVYDTDMKIPITLWSDKKLQKKFCDELNALHEENELLKGEVAHYKLILMSLEKVAKRMSSIRRFKND